MLYFCSRLLVPLLLNYRVKSWAIIYGRLSNIKLKNCRGFYLKTSNFKMFGFKIDPQHVRIKASIIWGCYSAPCSNHYLQTKNTTFVHLACIGSCRYKNGILHTPHRNKTFICNFNEGTSELLNDTKQKINLRRYQHGCKNPKLV